MTRDRELARIQRRTMDTVVTPATTHPRLEDGPCRALSDGDRLAVDQLRARNRVSVSIHVPPNHVAG